MEPTASVLSCQLRAVTVQIQGKDHFSFSLPSKYFSQKFPPFLTSLSPFSFSLLFGSIDGDGGGMGYRWVLRGGCGCVWGWYGGSLKATAAMGGGLLFARF